MTEPRRTQPLEALPRVALAADPRAKAKTRSRSSSWLSPGVAMMLFIFTQQKASLPSWAPFVGEEFVHITGEFETAQAVAPGQGQAVDIAGIQVGKITSVALEDGHAVVGMDIEPKYMELIHPDATLLMRPKTNLNDMVVEVAPGTGKGHLEAGDNIPLAQTESNTNLDAFLATLDADTRQYIQLLLAGGAEGVGNGRQLSRRLPPLPALRPLPRRHQQSGRRTAPGARRRDPQLRLPDHRTRPPRRRDRTLRQRLPGGARQLRQRAGGDPGIAGRVPGHAGRGPGRAWPARTPSRSPPARR